MHIPKQSLSSRPMLLPMLAKLDPPMRIAREPMRSLNVITWRCLNRNDAHLDTGSITGSFVVGNAVIIKKFFCRFSNLCEMDSRKIQANRKINRNQTVFKTSLNQRQYHYALNRRPCIQPYLQPRKLKSINNLDFVFNFKNHQKSSILCLPLLPPSLPIFSTPYPVGVSPAPVPHPRPVISLPQ